jgi:hypothetical protein
MLAIDTQLKKAFEEEHMTPEQIAEDQGLDLTAVKAKLMQISFLYRKSCMKEGEERSDLNFTDDQLAQVTQQMLHIALNAETPDGTPDYRCMLDACKYVRDDKKGRKEVVKAVQNQTFNLLSFNQAIQQAREGAQKIKQMVGQAPNET